jgi:hypothetical protein
MITLEKAEYEFVQDRPALTLTIDGQTASFFCEEFKPVFLRRGYLSLRDMDLDLPDHVVEVDGSTAFLSKVTSDPVILEVVKRFRATVMNDSFSPGTAYPYSAIC